MTLELDARQRAMLLEMGVHVWLPESGVTVLEQAAPPVQPAAAVARVPAAQAYVDRPVASPAPQSAPVAVGRAPTPAGLRPMATPTPNIPASAPDATSLDWTALAEAVRDCKACGLCAGRSNPSFLAPTEELAQCDWMVVGDVPDEDEDRAGAPFAGQDGVLLANMLRALGLQRANPLPYSPPSPLQPAAQRAYVTNVLKCRPALGAMPQAAELAQCAAYLQREIALVQPKFILAMGRYANQVLLAESPALLTQPLGKLRGTLHRYQGVSLVVTYPPKLLMRNSADKAKAWADLCFAAAALDAARAG
jgi:DNA polymerase